MTFWKRFKQIIPPADSFRIFLLRTFHFLRLFVFLLGKLFYFLGLFGYLLGRSFDFLLLPGFLYGDHFSSQKIWISVRQISSLPKTFWILFKQTNHLVNFLDNSQVDHSSSSDFFDTLQVDLSTNQDYQDTFSV